MTQTTVNRQLSLLVKGILESYKIDILQLEVDLVSALQRMWNEAGKDPAKMVAIREEILTAMLAQGAFENKLAEMESRFKAATGLSLDGRSRYDQMLRFLVKKDEEGQSVEQYARWCRENPYDAPKFFKIAEKPDMLMLTWGLAFQATEKKHADIEQDANGITVSW
jgi:hypothetical protein